MLHSSGNASKHVATKLSVDIKLSMNHIMDEYTKVCLILMTHTLMYFKCQIDYVLLMSHGQTKGSDQCPDKTIDHDGGHIAIVKTSCLCVVT